MPELTSYESPALPPDLKCQILSYIRMEWSWIFTPQNRFWDYTDKNTHPRNFVISRAGVLISHAETNWRMLQHDGMMYKVYGVSAVFTYPAFRREGFGGQVVAAASQHIDASDADFSLLFCLPEMEAFYAKHGWEVLPGLKISYGASETPELDEHAFTMVRFVSEKGKQARASMTQEGFYVGPYMW